MWTERLECSNKQGPCHHETKTKIPDKNIPSSNSQLHGTCISVSSRTKMLIYMYVHITVFIDLGEVISCFIHQESLSKGQLLCLPHPLILAAVKDMLLLQLSAINTATRSFKGSLLYHVCVLLYSNLTQYLYSKSQKFDSTSMKSIAISICNPCIGEHHMPQFYLTANIWQWTKFSHHI